MTLNEIVYNLADLLGKTDDPVLIERLKFNVLYYRDLLLRRDDDRNYRLPDNFLQTLQLSPAQAGDIWIASIPTVIELKDGPAVTYVGGSDYNSPYGWCRREEMSYLSASKYTQTAARFFFDNRRIGVTVSGDIIVRGVFYDPREVMELVGLYDTDNQYFPITGNLVQRITAGMMSGELQLKSMPLKEEALGV